MSEQYIIAGGDMRFASLADDMSSSNSVNVIGIDRKYITSDKVLSSLPEKKADRIILPIPVSTDDTTLNAPLSREIIKLESLLPMLDKNAVVFGGRISQNVKQLFSENGMEVIDYLEREELAVLNALATAEGAVQIALAEQPYTLSGQKILILGMGRIAKALIRILSGFGADITIAARKYSDLAWAEVYGCKGVLISDIKNRVLSEAELIYNTVPHIILTAEELRLCKRECLIIDLASKPGGMDFEAAGRLGIRAIWALSLPGKTAPVSSGRIIKRTIENVLMERR